MALAVVPSLRTPTIDAPTHHTEMPGHVDRGAWGSAQFRPGRHTGNTEKTKTTQEPKNKERRNMKPMAHFFCERKHTSGLCCPTCLRVSV